MTYWQRGKPLPADSARLANIARMSADQWADAEPVIAEFFHVENGLWVHKRIEAELARYRTKREKASASGKASAEQRANERTAPAQRTLNERSTDVERTPNYSDSTQVSEDITTTSEQEPAREVKVVQKFDLNGVGLSSDRPVSVDTVRQVARLLSLGDAQPLADNFHRWQRKLEPSKRAKDPDAVFLASAEKILSNANAAVRKACQPLKPPEPEIKVRNVRASSQLLAKLHA
jgi:uncharacterized protein YdaU (DUF1376 family)